MWKNYFTFTRTERNGMFVLLAIIILIVTLKLLLQNNKSHSKVDYSEFIQKVDSFENSLHEITQNDSDSSLLKYDSLKLFRFNPNNTSNEDWKSLGLSDYQIQIINNYLNKGGHFYNSSDFKKVYGISKAQADILIPFIDIPGSESKKETVQKELIKAFVFDPNTASDTDFIKLGLSQYNISTIRNYLNKGGHFYTPDDFEKIYGISESTYKQLKDFILIEKSNKDYSSQQYDSLKRNKSQLININTADSIAILQLPGIGTVFTSRIISYRNKLGGFYRKEQILEVYGMLKDRYNLIKDLIVIDSTAIKKIPLNFVTDVELSKHPYINYTDAQAIIKYRTKNGNYTNINQLVENNIINESTFRKIKVYLELK